MFTSLYVSAHKQLFSNIFDHKSKSIVESATSKNAHHLQLLTKKEMLAVAGGPEVENEPD